MKFLKGSLRLCLALGVAYVFGAFALEVAAGPVAKFTPRSFSLNFDWDDPASQRSLQQLEHLSVQLEKRTINLTLDQALDQGLLNNPGLASAFFDIQGSQWDLIASRRSWYPSLQITGNTANYKGQSNLLLGQAYSSSTITRPGSSATQYTQAVSIAPVLVLNWSFFDATRVPAINQALSSLFAQRFLFDVAARNLVLNLQIAYTNVQAEAELVQRYQWLLGLTRQQVLLAEVMVRQGRLTRASLDQLHTEQRLQLTRLIDRYQQLFTAANTLASLVAVPPGQIVLSSSPFTLVPPWRQDLDSSLQQALAFREEIKQKLALAERDRWSAIRAINGYLPVFGLTGAGTYGDTSSDQGSVQASQANLGLSFQWPLFDGGIKAADSSSLRSQAASQLSAANSEKLVVTKQVMDAYNVYITSRLALQNTGPDFALSRQTVKNAVRAFSLTRDVTTLVQVFNLYISAADRDVGATRQFNASVFGLYRFSALWPDGLFVKVAQRRGGN
jgi:outer membrane protein TolC